jgi:small neutral amino acid transporter SnatA (MarC family)
MGALTPFLQRSSHFQWLPLIALLQFSNKKNDIFNILWVLVFGFATLNILSLVARRIEPQRNRLSFGETLAIGVVLMSVALLGWELLNIFKIFPIKLHTRY